MVTWESFYKCSDICTLHVYKLCLNSSDEFQAFSHFLPGLLPEVKYLRSAEDGPSAAYPAGLGPTKYGPGLA